MPAPPLTLCEQSKVDACSFAPRSPRRAIHQCPPGAVQRLRKTEQISTFPAFRRVQWLNTVTAPAASWSSSAKHPGCSRSPLRVRIVGPVFRGANGCATSLSITRAHQVCVHTKNKRPGDVGETYRHFKLLLKLSSHTWGYACTLKY